MITSAIRRTITAIVLLAVLSACIPTAFSPEAGAAQAVADSKMDNFQVDPQTIQVAQSLPIDDEYVVLVRFQGNRAGSGREECLGVYRMSKGFMGNWNNFSSGSGCSNSRPPVEEMPFSSGLNWFSTGDQPNNQGYAVANGEVFDDSIVKILLTWNDGNTQSVDVVEQTYMAVRTGKFNLVKFEGLDDTGNVVFSQDMGRAPGKE